MTALFALLVGTPVAMALIYFSLGLGKNTTTTLSIDASNHKVISAQGLSNVANRVYREYMELPVESRPFDNIRDILISLDKVTAGLGNDRSEHFDKNDRTRKRYAHHYDINSMYPYDFSWNAANYCDHNTDCKYSAYYALHVEIERVKKALADKARALVESENAHNVSMAAELVKALRDEAGIQDKVTAELRS